MAIKKSTLADIIARKKQGELDKIKIAFYHSETLDADIEIRKIPLNEYMECITKLEDGDVGHVEAMNEVIFKCCPLFRENSTEAMEVYGASEPVELPSLILEEQLNELTDIFELIQKMYGIDKLKKEDLGN